MTGTGTGQSGRRGRLSLPRQGGAGAVELDSVDPAGAADAGAVVVVAAAAEAGVGVGGLFDAGGLSLEVSQHCRLSESNCCSSLYSRAFWTVFAGHSAPAMTDYCACRGSSSYCDCDCRCGRQNVEEARGEGIRAQRTRVEGRSRGVEVGNTGVRKRWMKTRDSLQIQ